MEEEVGKLYDSNAIEAFMIFFVNSGLLEFGDEIFCLIMNAAEMQDVTSCREFARDKILFIEENHTYAAIAGSLLGYVVLAPVAIIYYWEYGLPKTAKDVFISTFIIEIIEGGIAVIGQVFTDGNLQVAMLSLVIGFASGLVRGTVLAFMHQWNKSTPFRFKIAGLGILGVFGLFYYSGMRPSMPLPPVQQPAPAVSSSDGGMLSPVEPQTTERVPASPVEREATGICSVVTRAFNMNCIFTPAEVDYIIQDGTFYVFFGKYLSVNLKMIEHYNIENILVGVGSDGYQYILGPSFNDELRSLSGTISQAKIARTRDKSVISEYSVPFIRFYTKSVPKEYASSG